MPIEGDRFTVATATLGAFTVDGKAVANLGTETPVKLTPDVVGKVTAAIGSGKPVNANGTTIYVSQNRQNPAIGDLRISFSREDIAEASFIGAQKGAGITGYKATNGRELFLSAAGQVDAPQMFDAAQSENTLITWLHSRRRLARHVYRLCHDAVDPWHHRRCRSVCGLDRRLRHLGHCRYSDADPWPPGHRHRLDCLPAGARHRHHRRGHIAWLAC